MFRKISVVIVFLAVIATWTIALVNQRANANSLQQALESHLQQWGVTVKSVSPATNYRVNLVCDSIADCAEDRLPIGTTVKLYLNFQYSGVVTTLPEFYSSLLIYDSQRQVILGDAVSSWMESARARAVSTGGWGRFQATFNDLFLTQELPEGSQLIILAEHRNGVFTYHSGPITGTASVQGLSAPITTSVLESLPPRIKWTLPLKMPIAGNIFVRWYVEDMSSGGDIVAANSFVTPPNSPQQSTLTIISGASDKWESNACRMLNVYIDRNPVGRTSEVYQLPTVVATRFGGEC